MAKVKTGSERLDEWIAFLAGHWTMKKPKKAGTYPVAYIDDKDPGGVNPCNSSVLLFWAGSKLLQTNGGKWQGWWWSKPFPMLPPIPDTSGEKK